MIPKPDIEVESVPMHEMVSTAYREVVRVEFEMAPYDLQAHNRSPHHEYRLLERACRLVSERFELRRFPVPFEDLRLVLHDADTEFVASFWAVDSEAPLGTRELKRIQSRKARGNRELFMAGELRPIDEATERVALEIARWVVEELHELVEHELDECARYAGRLLYDPHGNGGR